MQITLEKVSPGRTGHLRLLPNINRSGRTLPETPSSDDLTANAKVDCERPTRMLSDTQIYSLMIDISDAEAKANPAMTLEASFDPMLFQLLNASGIPLPKQTTQPFTLDLAQARKDATKSRGVQFFVEALTFSGSPLLDPKASQTMAFRILDGTGGELLNQPTFGGADIRTADVILLGDDAPAERLLICDVGENGPSLSEVTAAAKAAGVPLTIVPIELGMGDSWMQDQFQIGYTATNEGDQRVIVHLPRVANDSSVVPGTANLRNVVDTYFPSDNIGVVKDFWATTVTVSDGSQSATLDVGQSFVVYKQLNMVSRILAAMNRLLAQAAPKTQPPVVMPGDIFAELIAIETVLAQLLAVRTAGKEVLDRIADVKPTVDRLSDTVFVKGGSVGLKLEMGNDKKTLLFAADTGSSTNAALTNFFAALSSLHSSRNYGGNIEVSPPMPDAPYGKILAGSLAAKPLIDFLTSRGKLHPLVTATTEWLAVGHIDEIAAFAPTSSGGFCLLRASPRLALSMLQKLVERQGQGSRVTRLFRGKKWVHKSTAKATDPLRPPKAYSRLLKSGTYDLSGFTTPVPKTTPPPFGESAFHDDRQFLVINTMAEADAHYAAMIGCADLLAVCSAANRAAEDLFLVKNYTYADDPTYQKYYDDDYFKKSILPFRFDKVVDDSFPGVKIYRLPVLFDHVADYFNDQVSALMPAAVNFQTLGSTALVPRPYGPRMDVAEAAKFVMEVLAGLDYPKVTVDEKFIRDRGLDKTWHWTRKSERVDHASLSNIPTPYDKSYKDYVDTNRLSAAQDSKLSVEAAMVQPYFDFWKIQHGNDPLANHPVPEAETLYRIAGYFKDGFDPFKNVAVDYCKGDTESAHPLADKYETDIKPVMDAIDKANPGVFDKNGSVIPTDWTRILIPEDTADVFEVLTHALMESLGLTVSWIDSWYYHTHFGGIHCGTNVLRRRS